ncbi:mechanosensitive ion channel family protein, partial [Thioclava sp. BHET1]
MSRLSDRLQSNASSVRGRQIWALLASLGQIILPMAGVLALMQLLLLTGLLGETGHALVLVLPGMGLMIFTAYWLGGQIFPREQTARAVFQLTPERQAEGRIHVASLGILLAIDILRRMLVDHLKADETASGVLAFPILVLVAIVLFRMGQLFRLHVKSSKVEGEPESYRDRLIGLLASILQLMAVIAPVLGAIGYIAAASAVVLPATMSLALLGLLVIVQRLAEDVYRWVMGSSSPEDDGVIPVLVGFALTLLSLPLFALIWG